MKREGKKREIGFNKGYVFFFFFFFISFISDTLVGVTPWSQHVGCSIQYLFRAWYIYYIDSSSEEHIEYDFRIEYYTLVVRERERKRVRFLSSANISIHGRNEQLYKSNVFFSSYRLRINVYNNEFICACFVVDSIFLNLLRDQNENDSQKTFILYLLSRNWKSK